MKRKKPVYYPYDPDYCVCTGEYVRSARKELKLKVSEFAELMNIAPQELRKIVSGETPVTEDIAEALERVTGTPRRIWLALEKQYQNFLETH